MRKIWIYAVCGLGLILGATQLQAQPLVPGPTLELSEIFGVGPEQVELGDANGDGHLDILVNDINADKGVLFLADGAGGFAPTRVAVTNGAIDIAFKDVNGDGLDDLIAATGSQQLIVFFGDPDANFELAPFAPLTLSDRPYAIEVADFDGSGNPDVAVVTRAMKIDLFLDDGSGGLNSAPGVEFTAENTFLSASGDVNGDGIADIAVVNPFEDPNRIRIFFGNNAGEFTEAPGDLVELNGRTETIAFGLVSRIYG